MSDQPKTAEELLLRAIFGTAEDQEAFDKMFEEDEDN